MTFTPCFSISTEKKSEWDFLKQTASLRNGYLPNADHDTNSHHMSNHVSNPSSHPPPSPPKKNTKITKGHSEDGVQRPTWRGIKNQEDKTTISSHRMWCKCHCTTPCPGWPPECLTLPCKQLEKETGPHFLKSAVTSSTLEGWTQVTHLVRVLSKRGARYFLPTLVSSGSVTFDTFFTISLSEKTGIQWKSAQVTSHTNTGVQTRTHRHIHIHSHTHTKTCVCTRTRMHTFTNTHIHKHSLTHMQAYVHTHTHTNNKRHTNIHPNVST